jgi:hypothetical protein
VRLKLNLLEKTANLKNSVGNSTQESRQGKSSKAHRLHNLVCHPPSRKQHQVQRQPLTQAAFPFNAQDDDESDIDEGENIDPSLRILAPMESNKSCDDGIDAI